METRRTVVLVEGESDRIALHTLAVRLGRDLAAENVEVVPMGGINNTRRFALRYGPRGLGARLTGLYDSAEEATLRHGLVTAGLDGALAPDALPDMGFHRCTADLEDELIRAVGVAATEDVIADAGEARALRLLSGMPAQRGWSREAVLRRFIGARSGRKARYARLLARAVDPGRVPHPLLALLEHV